MCYRVVERYAACKCLYFEHSIDPCSSFGQRGHAVLEKTVLVGYACSRHTRCATASAAASSLAGTGNRNRWPDSGYSSKGSGR